MRAQTSLVSIFAAVAAAALSFYLAKLKFPAWSFGTAIGTALVPCGQT